MFKQFGKTELRQVTIVLSISICLVGFLFSLFFNRIIGTKDDFHGVFDGYIGESNELESTLLTPEALQSEYDSRKSYPINFLQEMERKGKELLVLGNYAEYDEWLMEAQLMYKEHDELLYSIETEISKMRSALVTAKTFEKDYYGDSIEDYVNESRDDFVLASMLVSCPSGVQLSVLKHVDSLIFPPLRYAQREDISITRLEISQEEELVLINRYNVARTDESKYISLSIFEIEAYGYTWELLVAQKQNFTFTPILFTIKDEFPQFPITLSVLATWESFTSDAQLDKLLRDNFQLSFTAETALSLASLNESLAGLDER